MIGTIRKHSKWLWILVAGLTIISFVVFMGSGPARNGGMRASGGGYGSIYGQPVTAQEFLRARGDFFIFYWAHYGQWPDKNGSLTSDEIERETYIRLVLAKKAEKLGIHIGDDAVAAAAGEFLRSVGRSGQTVSLAEFNEKVLAPENLGVGNLQNFLRSELAVQQLIQVLGLAGALVTPQEAGLLYDQGHHEVSAQVVFFSASNYLASATPTPAAVAQYYTNNMAAYREPDRVQVAYVAFEMSNQLAAAEAKLGKTNLDLQVETAFRQQGMEAVPGAKTPDEAKAKMRDFFIRQEAAAGLRASANDFAAGLFAMEPARPENLAALAKKKGLAVRTTAPFSADLGPAEVSAPAAFAKAAFQLGPEIPFGGPVPGADGIYVLALVSQLPSAITPLDQVRARVAADFQAQQAVLLAQRAGTNYDYALSVALSAGRSFAQAAVAAGQVPVVLPPFSLSTAALPELGAHASLDQVKQAAFTTTPGHVSGFVPTSDGGFVLFVQQLLPLDEAKKKIELPQFLSQARRSRQNEAFNLWLQGEANHELLDTPYFKKQMAGAVPQP